MASVIRGDDNFDSAGIVDGAAKAWVNFNGTGTVAIRESYNVDSITDTATGRYYVNFTTAFSDNSYCVVTDVTRTYDLAGNNNAGSNSCDVETGRFEVMTQYLDGTLSDWQGVHCAVFR